MSRRVPELVSVQARDANLLAAPLEHLPDAVSTQRSPTLLREPQGRQVCPSVTITQAQVPAERLGGLEAEGDDPDTGALTDDGDVPLIKRHVCGRESGDLS